MIKITGSIDQVKKSISELKEKQVEVTLNLGRNKFKKFMAELSGVYPALFTVKPLEEGFIGKTSYSYSEYMCGKVRISIKDKAN